MLCSVLCGFSARRMRPQSSRTGARPARPRRRTKEKKRAQARAHAQRHTQMHARVHKVYVYTMHRMQTTKNSQLHIFNYIPCYIYIY